MISSRTSNRFSVIAAVVWLAPAAQAGVQPSPGDGMGAPPNPVVYTRWDVWTSQDGLPCDEVTALRSCEDTLWVGTVSGVAQRRGGRVVATWGAEDGLPDAAVSVIEVDPVTHDVWIGFRGGGLVRLTAGRVDAFDQLNSGLAGDIVFDLVPEGDRVWVATGGGVSVFHPFADRWDLYDTRRRGAPDVAVTSLVPDGDTMIAGVWRTGLRRYASGQARWCLKGQRDFMFALPAAGTDRRRSVTALWSVSDDGIRRHTMGAGGCRPASRSIRHELPAVGSERALVRVAATAANGTMWIGADRSLLAFDDEAGETWVAYRTDDEGRLVATLWRAGRSIATKQLAGSFPPGGIQAIAADDGAVWLGTRRGLLRAHGGMPWSRLTALTRGSPLEASHADHSEPDCKALIATYGPRGRTIAIPGADGRSPMADQWAIVQALRDWAPEASDRAALETGSYLAPAGYSRYDWLLPEDDIAVFARNPDVAAAVGYLGSHDLIADAVIYRSELPWIDVSPVGDGDVEAGRDNPWVFRCWGNRPRELRAIFDYAVRAAGDRRVGAVTMSDRASRRHLSWWRDHARRCASPLVAQVTCEGSPGSIERGVDRLLDGGPLDVVLSWCDRPTTLALLNRLRSEGSTAVLVTHPSLADTPLPERLADRAGAMVALLGTVVPPAGGHHARLAERFSRRAVARRHPEGPPDVVIRSYDGTSHVLEALRVVAAEARACQRAGDAGAVAVDRAALRRRLERMERDVTGESHFEEVFGPCWVAIARLVDGRWAREVIRVP